MFYVFLTCNPLSPIDLFPKSVYNLHMPNLNRSSLFRILAILFSIFFLFVAFLFFFQRSNSLFFDKVWSNNFRTRIDDTAEAAFLHNTLGYRTLYKLVYPNTYIWRPSRVVPGYPVIPDLAGNNDFQTIFGEIVGWRPDESRLLVQTYLSYNHNFIIVDVAPETGTLVFVPKFGEDNQPIWESPPTRNFVTYEELAKLYNVFPDEASFQKFIHAFGRENEDMLIGYIISNFGGPDTRIHSEASGYYSWDNLFCNRDIIAIQYPKDVNTKEYLGDESKALKAGSVSVESRGCPTLHISKESKFENL